jgi:hypothetical protein
VDAQYGFRPDPRDKRRFGRIVGVGGVREAGVPRDGGKDAPIGIRDARGRRPRIVTVVLPDLPEQHKEVDLRRVCLVSHRLAEVRGEAEHEGLQLVERGACARAQLELESAVDNLSCAHIGAAVAEEGRRQILQ